MTLPTLLSIFNALLTFSIGFFIARRTWKKEAAAEQKRFCDMRDAYQALHGKHQKLLRVLPYVPREVLLDL